MKFTKLFFIILQAKGGESSASQSGRDIRLTPGAEFLVLTNFMKVREHVLRGGVHEGKFFTPAQIRQLDDNAGNRSPELWRRSATV